MKSTTQLVVFTDLDGTLLDHDTYGWHPAAPALERLAGMDAPVILASSKTAAEIAIIQEALGLTKWPAIVENGSGLLGQECQPTYPELRAILNKVPPDLRALFQGFGDMSIEQVATTTGLSFNAARLAKERQFSEPGMWSGTKEQRARFEYELRKLGVAARSGGRFLTLSFGKTKADQMAANLAQFEPLTTVALGDAPNDIEMLQTADVAVVITNPHRPALPKLDGEPSDRIIRTSHAGPKGWNMAMMDLMDKMGL